MLNIFTSYNDVMNILAQTGGVGGGAAAGQLPVDMAQVFNNPALIGMASQMLSDPNFRNT